MVPKKIILIFVIVTFFVISFFLRIQKNSLLIGKINQQEVGDNKNIVNNEEPNLNNDNRKLDIIERLVSWGYKTSPHNRLLDTIIIHSSYDALGDDPYNVDGVIQEYKSYRVSPHYLINRDGVIIQLVKEKNIAYHAGEGKMPDSRTNINSFSIGIEIMNMKLDNPTKVQYLSLVKLVKFLELKYKIKNILGHNQISPERKTDPWNFNWQKFNEMLKG